MRKLIGYLVAVSGGVRVVAPMFVARASRFAGEFIFIAYAVIAEIAGTVLPRSSASV